MWGIARTQGRPATTYAPALQLVINERDERLDARYAVLRLWHAVISSVVFAPQSRTAVALRAKCECNAIGKRGNKLNFFLLSS